MPEAEPFIQVIEAVQANDVNKFKNAFSMRINEEDKNTDWLENLNEAKANFESSYGKRYNLREFSFKYDHKSNLLIVSYKEKEQFRIALIKEKNNWKLNER